MLRSLLWGVALHNIVRCSHIGIAFGAKLSRRWSGGGKRKAPAPRVEVGGLVVPEAPAMWSALRSFLLADSLLYCFESSC